MLAKTLAAGLALLASAGAALAALHLQATPRVGATVGGHQHHGERALVLLDLAAGRGAAQTPLMQMRSLALRP